MIVLLIGGTGSLGKAMIPTLLKDPSIDRIRILSRGEHTQMELAENLKSNKVDFFVGDVRDADRVLEASEGCKMVYHLAAMKSVDKAEYDPWEAVLTNIEGAKNVIEASKKNHVSKAVFISTDKAVAPLNIYGATKLVAEKLFIQANIGAHQTRFSVCRYGNVFGSQGSVFKKWKDQLTAGEKVKITHEEMTRFFLTPAQAAEFVIQRSYESQGGEVFIPKMKSTTMINLARAFSLIARQYPLHLEDVDWIGVRPGEKIHEILISKDEVNLTTDLGDFFIRWPNYNLFPIEREGEPIEKSFTSKNAERFSEEELKEMIEWELYALSPKSDPPIWGKSITPKNSSSDAQTTGSTPSSSSSSPIQINIRNREMSGSIQTST